MEIALTIFYALLFIFLIYKIPFFRIEGFGYKSLIAVFILKIAAGVLMYYIYTYHYTDRSTADIFKYFDDSLVMHRTLFTNPLHYVQMMTGIGNDAPQFAVYYDSMNNWYRVYESNLYNDSHTIIRINALLRLFSFGYFNVHMVFMCFISLSGLVALYKFFVPYMEGKTRELFVAVFLLPSVLFWGSGVLKEAVLLFGMGMLLYNIDKLTGQKFKVRWLLWMLFSLLLLIYTKYYIFIILVPLLVSYVWCNYTHQRHCLLKYAAVLLVYLIGGFSLHYVFPDYNALEIIAQKQNDFVRLALHMESGSLISPQFLQPDLFSVLIQSPVAFLNTLFRPFIFESGSLLVMLSAIENLLLLIVILLCIVFSSWKIANKPVFYLCLFFFVIIFTLTGLTTPVMGAIVRYKVPAMPFMLIFFIMILNKEKLKRYFPFLTKIKARHSFE